VEVQEEIPRLETQVDPVGLVVGEHSLVVLVEQEILQQLYQDKDIMVPSQMEQHPAVVGLEVKGCVEDPLLF
jgi:hypothetical protein